MVQSDVESPGCKVRDVNDEVEPLVRNTPADDIEVCLLFTAPELYFCCFTVWTRPITIEASADSLRHKQYKYSQTDYERISAEAAHRDCLHRC